MELSYISHDGEEGYPGTLHVKVIYLLTDYNELRIYYEATTNIPTICNMTNHSYFNLKDAGKSSILEHLLTINADSITTVDDTHIPTGEFLHVESTPFDFRKEEIIGSRIEDKHEQLKFGYDHNYVLNGNDREMRRAAVVSE